MRAREFLIDNIILETPEEVRAQIIQKVQNIPDESDLINIAKYANQYFFKQDVGQLSKVKGYKEKVSDIILQAVGKIDAPSDKIKAFLNKLATDGILSEGELLTPGKVHSLANMIEPAYAGMFKAIQSDLFQNLAGKNLGDRGDVGKGEYLLSILSPHITRRGAPGDITIDDTKVEIKAGKNGRLGPAGSVPLIGRLPKFIEKCIRVGILTKEETDQNPPDPIALSFKQNMSEFSSYFGNDPKRVSSALSIMLQMHYPTLDVGLIVAACLKGTVISGTAIKSELLKASYTVYQNAKQFDGILITDININRYLYINSPESAAASSSLLYAGYPTWAGGQSDCVKVTLATGRQPK